MTLTAEKPQHMKALDNANGIRLERAQIKREVKAGTRRVPDLLLDLPECLKTMRPEELLRCIHHFQSRVAQSMIADAEASPMRQLGLLTIRQRRELAAMVTDWEVTRDKAREKAAA